MTILSDYNNYSFNLINRLSINFSESFGEKDFFEVAGDFSLDFARKSFGAEIVSNYQNKTQAEKIDYCVIHIFLFLLTLPLSSLVSLTGIVLIFLSKSHQNKFNQLQNGGQLPSSPSSLPSSSTDNSLVNLMPLTPEQLSSAQFLEELSKRHMSIHEKEQQKGVFTTILDTLQNDYAVFPDLHKFSDLILECQNDDEAYFVPSNSWENSLKACEGFLIPERAEHMAFLIKVLSAAFETGKKIVVARLGSETHAVAAGFSVDGQFKIIDSQFNSTINTEYLTQQLNQACIKNSQKNIITFAGEYVNTSIQKAWGTVCMRFATLYCYQMYKSKDLEAYQEVSGAFAEGKLKRFEDYKQISKAKKIQSFDKSHSRDLYDKFMRSWVYRTFGFLVDTWEELKPSHVQLAKMSIYFLENDPEYPEFPPRYKNSSHFVIEDENGLELTINNLNEMPKKQEIPLNKDDSVTLGELVSSSNEKRLLIFEEGENQPRLYRLLPHQRIRYLG